MQRFERQINLRGFGVEGQRRLMQSSALIVGVGGLGCPALLYLAAAGVKRIGIADGDIVSMSNLNRQVLFGIGDNHKKKTETAAIFIREKYDDVQIDEYSFYLDVSNSLDIISQYDIVLDCTDNFSVRYMVNDACLLLNKPVIYGAIYEYEGQVSVFNIQNTDGCSYNYRDLFPDPPDSSQIPNCNETGVLGVLPGIIGTMQAAETIKILSGIGTSLSGKVLYYNIEYQQFYDMDIIKSAIGSCKAPQNMDEFCNHDYSLSCSVTKSIDWNEAKKIYNEKPDQTIYIDVRELDEFPKVSAIECLILPMSLLPDECYRLSEASNLLIFCRSGIRSEKAAQMLQSKFPQKSIYSIKGGVLSKLSPIYS